MVHWPYASPYHSAACNENWSGGANLNTLLSFFQDGCIGDPADLLGTDWGGKMGAGGRFRAIPGSGLPYKNLAFLKICKKS